MTAPIPAKIKSMIKRVSPSAIANEIISVQPMTGAFGQIFERLPELSIELNMFGTIACAVITHSHSSSQILARNLMDECKSFLQDNYTGDDVDWCFTPRTSSTRAAISIRFNTEQALNLFRLKYNV